MIRIGIFTLVGIIMAQVTPDVNLASALVIYGPMGAMLGWFMLRIEKLIKEISLWREELKKDNHMLSHRLDGMTRATLIDVLSREDAGHQSKKMASEMLEKIENRNGKND